MTLDEPLTQCYSPDPIPGDGSRHCEKSRAERQDVPGVYAGCNRLAWRARGGAARGADLWARLFASYRNRRP